jgi:hypothetical protein
MAKRGRAPYRSEAVGESFKCFEAVEKDKLGLAGAGRLDVGDQAMQGGAKYGDVLVYCEAGVRWLRRVLGLIAKHQNRRAGIVCFRKESALG